MKKIIVPALLMIMSVPMLFSQDKGCSWQEKIRSERIAFLSQELSLTPAEAEKFWPVYNMYKDQREELQKAVRETFRALDGAMESGRDVDRCLNEYVKALDAGMGKETEAMKAYKKVLPPEKVAKLYLAEEKFRMQQIHRLHHWQGKDKASGGDRGSRPSSGK